MPECPICHWPTRFVLTEAGKRIACDPTATQDGVIVLLAVGWTLRGHVLDGGEMPWQGASGPGIGPFVPHERTCGQGGRASRAPACRDCGYELHPIIVARGGTVHWLCGGALRPALVLVGAPDNTPEQLDLPEAS